jgi:hypothetical protein
MKGLILALTMITPAYADTLIQLPIPPALIGVGYAPRTACAGAAFNDDNSVRGACHTVTSAPCSGRGCQPVTYTTDYIAVWDALGNPLVATACAVIRHHLPQADQITYLNGFTAGDCFGVRFNPTGTVVMVDGAPYYYVATSVTGAELVNSNVAGYLYLP